MRTIAISALAPRRAASTALPRAPKPDGLGLGYVQRAPQ
jgi:hypothetical protein